MKFCEYKSVGAVFGYQGNGEHQLIYSGKLIEYLARNVASHFGDTRITGIEIKYQDNPPIIHGIMDASDQRIPVNLDLKKKEFITEFRVDCHESGVAFLSVATNLKRGDSGGQVHAKDIHVANLANQRIAGFRGTLGTQGSLQGLGLYWATADFGNWPRV